MSQLVSQIAGQLRKGRGQLRRASLTRLRHDVLEADYCYLRISSKDGDEASISPNRPHIPTALNHALP